jgi:ribosome biogenesis GTPase
LLRLPSGALVVDTPGIRELEVWHGDAGESATAEAFDDVAALAAGCRFRDCRHGVEPGCAVRDAVARGELARDRYEGFLKLLGERDAQDARTSARARADRSRQAKVATRALRARLEDKRPKE